MIETIPNTSTKYSPKGLRYSYGVLEFCPTGNNWMPVSQGTLEKMGFGHLPRRKKTGHEVPAGTMADKSPFYNPPQV